MTGTNPIIETALSAAFKLAETTPWGDLTLSNIASKAGLSLSDFHGVADKGDLSAAVEVHFDAAMSEGSVSEDETARTRLFDVIMMRFEAMEDSRDAAMSYLRWRDRSLAGLTLRVKARFETAKWALACAGLDKQGNLPKEFERTAIAWTISQAERAWRRETGSDLSQTMAALDAELLKLEERSDWLKKLGRSKAKPDQTADPDPQ